jgi:phosphatidylserine decarboxylase
VSELLRNEPSKDETTGLYKQDGAEGINDMQEFRLELKTAKEMPWESKHKPILRIR